MTKQTYAHYDAFCNVCGVSEGSRRWDKGWWRSFGDKLHICPDCQGIVQRALAIGEFAQEQEHAINLTCVVKGATEEEYLDMKRMTNVV